MTTTVITMSKADIIERLKSQIKLAEKHDREAIAQHKKDEHAHLLAFREACREALKWDYLTAKAKDFSVGGYALKRSAPSCPLSKAVWLKNELLRIELSSQETYKAGPATSLHRALVWDPTPVDDPCA